MDLSTLNTTFEKLFDREALSATATRLGAQDRERKVKAYDFVLALVSAGCVGPERSIAAVRRSWEILAGETIAPKSFDAHFNPGMVRMLWELIRDVMAPSNRALRREWPAPLRDLYDVLIIDGTRMAVDAGLAEILRGTTPGQSALKLLGAWSLGDGHLTDVRAGAAVHHDRKLLRLGTLVAGALYLLDLGFYDHDLFAGYADAEAFFASRLKENAMPTLAAVVTGVAEGAVAVGARLDGGLTYGPVVDVDARFSVHDDPDVTTRVFRVVKLDVARTDRHGRRLGTTCACWYVTNLPRATWTVAMIAAVYRLRWAIERVWREAKHLARLDHLRSERPVVLFIFVAASLLLHLLAEDVIAHLALAWGVGQVSRDRVLAVLLAAWHDLARDLHAGGAVHPQTLATLAAVVEREGRHPNPGQPRRIATVFKTLAEEARNLAAKAA